MARDREQGYRSDQYDRDDERSRFERAERDERDERWERNRNRGEFAAGGEYSRRQPEWGDRYRGERREPEFDEGWQGGRSYRGSDTRDDRMTRGYSGRGRDWSERDFDYRGGEDFGGYSSAPWGAGYRGRFSDARLTGGYGGYESGLGAYGPSTGFGYGPAGSYIGPESAGRVGEVRPRNFTGRGPRGYRRSDERIREDVNERLTRHPDLDATDVDVRVENCIVTLTGVVEDRRAKRLAEDIAEDIWGADDVRNELKIRHGFLASLTGEQADERDVTRPAVRDTTESARKGIVSRPGTTGSTTPTTE